MTKLFEKRVFFLLSLCMAVGIPVVIAAGGTPDGGGEELSLDDQGELPVASVTDPGSDVVANSSEGRVQLAITTMGGDSSQSIDDTCVCETSLHQTSTTSVLPSTSTKPTPTSKPSSTTTRSGGGGIDVGYWGNPQTPYSLADTDWEGGRIVSHRVVFPFSGTLESVRVYLIFVPGKDGGPGYYHGGDGGTFTMSLETDDGTSNHFPSGNILSTSDHIIGMPSKYNGSGPSGAVVGGDPGDNKYFRNIKLNTPVDVEAGQYYHLTFRNTSSNPATNFISIDDFYAGTDDKSPKVGYAKQDFGVLYKDPGSGWVDRTSHWAIGEYHFADGQVYGNGYMEVGSVSGPDRVAHYVNGSQSVRQVFTPPQDMTIGSINLAAMHVSGTNKLNVRLLDSAGNTVASGAIGNFPSGTPTGGDRGGVSSKVATFQSVQVTEANLVGGEQYYLEVTSAGGVHTVTGARDGSVSYRFSESSVVVGRAELSTSSGGWTGWPLREHTNSSEFDLSFYFGLR